MAASPGDDRLGAREIQVRGMQARGEPFIGGHDLLAYYLEVKSDMDDLSLSYLVISPL